MGRNRRELTPITDVALKQQLFELFSQYGNIVEIVALKTLKMRGQAFIVYRDVRSATSALRSLQGFVFREKPLRINYAKTTSDAIAKLNGTYVHGSQEDERNAKRAKVDAKRVSLTQKNTNAPSGPAGLNSVAMEVDDGSNAQPNRILFLEKLPSDVPAATLRLLFKDFPGFLEIRQVQQLPGIAFVEFSTEVESTVAMNALQGFKIKSDCIMHISYAKK